MAEESQPKWEGKTTAELSGPTAEQIWPFWEDFCNLHLWHPDIDTCSQVEGTPGQPGLIRYCATKKTSSSGGDDGISWCKEKILMIDPVNRCLSYELLENSIGFKLYVATIKVLSVDGDGGRGCKIEWSFVADPVEGWKFEDLVAYIETCLLSMAKKMEQSVGAHNGY
ncbi:hypothetical protein SLEP1_g15745 [Rubroshorea leprosula]|uniref:Lachrymatory factor synthase n=1 Tax=Rubroshorea leprosula TaxID=152421 RepID=A0AAV5IXU5_9ROSI|nr:hypothetical protein SLEP1_g15745 [Rubroshorea leprosula]